MTSPGSLLAAQRCQVPHTCPICGQGFTGLKTARFCSNRCKQRDKYQKRKGVTKMYAEKTRLALVAADQRAQQELGLKGHSPVAGSISVAGLGVSNAIHRGWLDSGEHDIADQIKIAEWAGLNLPVR